MRVAALPSGPADADPRPAPAARPAAPAVHPGLLAAAKVAGGRLFPAVLVRTQQTLGQLDDRVQISNVADWPPRVEAAQEQHLGLIQVADPGQVPLVEECLADRAVGACPEAALGLRGIPVGAEQVRAGMADPASLDLQ